MAIYRETERRHKGRKHQKIPAKKREYKERLSAKN